MRSQIDMDNLLARCDRLASKSDDLLTEQHMNELFDNFKQELESVFEKLGPELRRARELHEEKLGQQEKLLQENDGDQSSETLSQESDSDESGVTLNQASKVSADENGRKEKKRNEDRGIQGAMVNLTTAYKALILVFFAVLAWVQVTMVFRFARDKLEDTCDGQIGCMNTAFGFAAAVVVAWVGVVFGGNACEDEEEDDGEDDEEEE